MKNYIFLTYGIHTIGGCQTYIAGKAKFLESKSWRVTVFFSGRSNNGGCAVKSLEKYTAGWFPEISIPPGNWPSFIRNSVLRDMRNLIGDASEEILIESQASAYALWGELLAKELGAKHVFFSCDELFHEKNTFYDEYLPFFDFKHQRREFVGDAIKFFEGYKSVAPEENYLYTPASEDPVQNISNAQVDAIQRMDWNICYIGRIVKGYVPNIIMGVHALAAEHSEKKIQMVFVGNVQKRLKMIEQTFMDTPNVNLVYLGDCVPIPRSLYRKLDVVIGGSDCAVRSAQEGALTIVADAENFMANGVLGIDTFEAHFSGPNRGKQTDFKTVLERVFVQRAYAGKQMKDIPRSMPAEYYYKEQLRLIERSDQSKKYYDVVKNRKFSRKPSWMYYRAEWMVKILYRKHILARKK